VHAGLNHLKGQQAHTMFATQCVNLVLYVRDITDQYKALIFTNLHDLCSNNNNNSGNESEMISITLYTSTVNELFGGLLT